jgi:hypothetical protein
LGELEDFPGLTNPVIGGHKLSIREKTSLDKAYSC